MTHFMYRKRQIRSRSTFLKKINTFCTPHIPREAGNLVSVFAPLSPLYGQ